MEGKGGVELARVNGGFTMCNPPSASLIPNTNCSSHHPSHHCNAIVFVVYIYDFMQTRILTYIQKPKLTKKCVRLIAEPLQGSALN